MSTSSFAVKGSSTLWRRAMSTINSKTSVCSVDCTVPVSIPLRLSACSYVRTSGIPRCLTRNRMQLIHYKSLHSLATPLSAKEIFHEALASQEFTDAEIDTIVERMPLLLNYAGTPDVNHNNESSRLFNQIQTLRSLGLNTKAIKKLVMNYPHVLTMPDLGWIAGQIELLTEWFPKRDLEKMLERSPQILLEEWDDIRDRVYYAHYRMGLDQGDMQTANLLGHSFELIKGRHLLLCLLGRYTFPDKERMEGRLNPPLDKLFNVSDKVFATKYAGIDAEEYSMFKKLYYKTIVDRRDIPFFEEYPFPIRSVPRFNDVWSAKELVDEERENARSAFSDDGDEEVAEDEDRYGKKNDGTGDNEERAERPEINSGHRNQSLRGKQRTNRKERFRK